jgi:hypothetical protein
MGTNWLDSYYEALEFFYWQPQHIGRKKTIGREFELKKVVKHLREMEVTLNHNINQFLLLAPAALLPRLFNELFAREFKLEFEMHGQGVDADFKLENAVQPDFLFISAADVVSIEMKVGAKSSIEQVLKYALLGLAAELLAGSTKTHYLGFLGVGDFSSQWKEKFASPVELRHALNGVDLRTFLQTRRKRFREHQERFDNIVEHMHLGFFNYERFAEVLNAEVPPPTDKTPGAQV